jgi:ketosteroid isomerase-like protein
MNHETARALVERQARAWKRADPAAIVADFAPDGVLISPRGRWRGHDAVRRAAESVFAAVSDVQVVVTRVLLEADQGRPSGPGAKPNRADGRRHTVEDAIIFELRDDKLVSWREYLDTAGLKTT